MLTGTCVVLHVYARGQASTMSRKYDDACRYVSHIVCHSHCVWVCVCVGMWVLLCVPLCRRLTSENVLRRSRCSLQAPAGEALLCRF